LTIGAEADNTIILDDPAVSRHHAQIKWHNGRYIISDNQSTNGVQVNQNRIGTGEFPLQTGDTITIGRTNLTFILHVTQHPPGQPSVPYPPSQAPVQSTSQPPVQQTPQPRYQVPTPLPRPAVLPLHPPAPTPREVASTPPVISQPTVKPQALSSKRVLDGRYELVALLGQDGLGTLYRARRLALGDQVAVRILRPDLVDNPQALERFRRQAFVAARIRHPNAMQIYDFIVSPDGTVYIVEELLSGKTLRELIRTEPGLGLSRVVSLFNQICGAVHAAHLSGVVLRDLRPESIHLEMTTEGQEIVKVSGSGLAKLDSATGGGLTMADVANEFGDARYMSPEQWQGLVLDSRADVYSLGIILFELLTGSVPFDAPSRYEIADLHTQSPPPDLADYGRPDLDEGINAVVNRALAKDPNRRPPTTLHLAAEFEAVTNVKGGLLGSVIQRATGMLPVRPIIVPQAPAPVPAGEAAFPSVVAEVEEKGRGTFNAVVVALMAEAFLSRVSGGLVKTVVPLYGLLVFGLDITSVMGLVLIQNVVPLLLRPLFGSLADRYGKKRVFMISLVIRTLVSLLYAFATLPILFIASAIRGIADSAKGPSASAMIADHTDERNIAKAYSWYTTTKSTSGSIGESFALWLIPVLLAFYIASQTVTTRVAIIEDQARPGQQIVEVLGNDPPESIQGKLTPTRRLVRVEEQPLRLAKVPLEKLPKVVNSALLQRAIILIFLISTALSAASVILVAVFIQDKKKSKAKKKTEGGNQDAVAAEGTAPNIWAYALLGTALTAPGYMVTGEFFVILAVKMSVTSEILFYIKLAAELVIPLLFGPFFGWVADRIGAGKVLGLRSIINLITSVLFWVTSQFTASLLFGVLLGLARGLDEIGKAAFKPTWGAVAAKVSSFNLAARSKTMGILETGVDSADLIFPQVAGLLFQQFGLPILMLIRGAMALLGEIYTFLLLRKSRFR
jgi:serine/threonine-protein kinase